ncbi:MAG: heat-inducible transcriptional repressor HrcA [Lachnospiraceae bacterium]|nr:heat-inducible transcriptional repressor HrcA [Lachnospiraceae bacterium]
MELGERKRKILYAIIQNYQETGEPVGSRTISKYLDVKLSPATIRNEMSDLEEMGLIVQPHTSAGRIPTDKGYRLYVDSLLENEKKQLPAETNREGDLLIRKVDRLEEMLLQMAKILAANTNYATVITGPQYKRNKLKFIQLSPMEDGKLLAVVVTEGNIVKNNILHVGCEMSREELLSLNLLLNSNLNGLTMEEINLDIITKMKEEAGEHSDIVNRVLDAVADSIRGEEKVRYYTSGAPNIFKYPELTGGDTASRLISTLEEKEPLGDIVFQPKAEGAGGDGDRHDIQVYIGEEVPVEAMKDCSVVTATYSLSEGVQGRIGIIGPKRMDYEKVVDTLKSTMSQLDDIFDNGEDKKS